jgi:hypothetical protein
VGTALGFCTGRRGVGELWAALRDVAAEHVAGLDRLAAADRGDRQGVELHWVQDDPAYEFISDSAQGATKTFGVKSNSVLATKIKLQD